MENLKAATILNYFCKKCDIEFENSELLMNHLDNCTKNELTCNICGKLFTSISCKLHHQEMVHGGMKKNCDIKIEIFDELKLGRQNFLYSL